MNTTAQQEAAYVLAYSLSRAQLGPEAQEEYDRLLARREADRARYGDLPPINAPPHHLDFAGKWLLKNY